MSPAVEQILLGPPWLNPRYPATQAGLQAWYDASDPSSMLNNSGAIPASGDGIKLWADKSGNSNANVLCLNGVNSNYASFAALTAFGTGDFTVSARVRPCSLAALGWLHSGNGNSFGLILNATGSLQASKVGVSTATVSSGLLVAFAEVVVTYVRSGTTGTYYIDGVSVGTTTDSSDYTVGMTVFGASGATGASVLNGNVRWTHAYTRALSAGEITADAAGTIQSGSVIQNIDFSFPAKLATTFTATTGGTVTINTSGDTGARICGARDLYQGTVANQPVLTIAGSGNLLTFDGTNDYMKAAGFALAQPTSVYFTGSQVSWTDLDYFYDGGATNDGMFLRQNSSTPSLLSSAGGAGSALSTLAVGAVGVLTSIFNGASSLLRLNRQAPVTGSYGTGVAINGLTLGSTQSGATRWANITASEIAIYSAAHDVTTQDRFALYAGRKWRFAV